VSKAEQEQREKSNSSHICSFLRKWVSLIKLKLFVLLFHRTTFDEVSENYQQLCTFVSKNYSFCAESHLLVSHCDTKTSGANYKICSFVKQMVRIVVVF
jgi:hypothetical protein